MTEAQRQHRFLVILCFGLVYLFWGSTYLGIRIAVEHISPALMCGTRFSVAGILMLAYLALRGRNIRYSRVQLGQMAVVGILLLVGGNLTLSYAEQIVPSGLAALMIASTPLWFLVLDSLLLGDHHISARGMAGLALGIAGIMVLLWPKLTATGTLGTRELWWSVSLLGGSFSWALGSVLSKRWQSSAVDPFSATAWQVTFAGLANLIFAVSFEDISQVTWTARGLGAVFYLVVCGSWIGYTAYIWLLGHVPTSKVSTYAYVNPVVAVFLGWLLVNETVDRYILAGSIIVVASVALVSSAKIKAKTVAEEMPAVEAAGD
ncbi:MAG TPA: EamA family transporter [Terriglobales bacterium]|nr:EamA family transporter [Terriglobales bacterium]